MYHGSIEKQTAVCTTEDWASVVSRAGGIISMALAIIGVGYWML